MQKIRGTLLVAIIAFLIGVILIFFIVARLLENPQKTKVESGDQNNKPVVTKTQKLFTVVGHIPKKDVITSFGTQFEVQFTLPPLAINVTTPPYKPLIITIFPSKTGGYITISPQDGWDDNTKYTITIMAGSLSSTGEKLQSDYQFSFTLKQYRGL